MNFRYKKDYLKRFDRFSGAERNLIISADKEVRDYYSSHCAPYGLRIKKLGDSGNDKIFEARISDKLRILWIESADLVTFVILGNHTEIKNYLKNFR